MSEEKNQESGARTITTRKHGRKRRKLMQAVTIGGAAASTLPAHWSRPVLKQVVLPVHAATSDCGNIRATVNFGGDGSVQNCDTTFNSGDTDRSCTFQNTTTVTGIDISIDPPMDKSLAFNWSADGEAFSGVVSDSNLLGHPPGDGSGQTIDTSDSGNFDGGSTGVILITGNCPQTGSLGFSLRCADVDEERGPSHCPTNVTINFTEIDCVPPV